MSGWGLRDSANYLVFLDKNKSTFIMLFCFEKRAFLLLEEEKVPNASTGKEALMFNCMFNLCYRILNKNTIEKY